MKGLDVAVLRSVSAVADLRDAWQALSAPFMSPLLDHDWFLTAAESLHEEADLRVVVVRHAERVAAIAPLALDGSRRRLMLIGAAALYEPGGLLYASDDALQALLTATAGLGDATVLQRLPAQSVPARSFRERLRLRGLAVVRETAPSYAVATSQPWTDYVRTLKGRPRRRLEQARRRTAALSSHVVLDEVAPSPATVDALFDQLMATEHAGWKGRRGSSLTSRLDLERFYRRYAQRLAARDQLRVTRLRIGDDVAAMEFAAQAYGRRWSLKFGYDERFASCSPAIQVVHASIQAAFEQGLDAYEFLGSAEPWQERWKPERRAYVTAVVYPFRLRALVTAVQDATGVFTRARQSTRNVAV